MKREKILGVVRHVLTFGGGYAVARGWIDEETMMTIVGAVITIGGSVWSIMAPEKQA
jgi:hypothetical protein